MQNPPAIVTSADRPFRVKAAVLHTFHERVSRMVYAACFLLVDPTVRNALVYSFVSSLRRLQKQFALRCSLA